MCLVFTFFIHFISFFLTSIVCNCTPKEEEEDGERTKIHQGYGERDNTFLIFITQVWYILLFWFFFPYLLDLLANDISQGRTRGNCLRFAKAIRWSKNTIFITQVWYPLLFSFYIYLSYLLRIFHMGERGEVAYLSLRIIQGEKKKLHLANKPNVIFPHLLSLSYLISFFAS